MSNVLVPGTKQYIKRLTRRRRELVNEKTRILNRLQSDLQGVCPGLLEITGRADNKWFLNFLVSAKNFSQLAKIQRSSLLKISGIGKKWVDIIQIRGRY